jgi:hypothetical protein
VLAVARGCYGAAACVGREPSPAHHTPPQLPLPPRPANGPTADRPRRAGLHSSALRGTACTADSGRSSAGQARRRQRCGPGACPRDVCVSGEEACTRGTIHPVPLSAPAPCARSVPVTPCPAHVTRDTAHTEWGERTVATAQLALVLLMSHIFNRPGPPFLFVLLHPNLSPPDSA